MNEHSEQYKKIRKDAELNWPQWKIQLYNNATAEMVHAIKLKSDYENALENVRELACGRPMDLGEFEFETKG